MPKILWTRDEIEIIATKYPSTPMRELKGMLPRFSEKQIYTKAAALNLKKDYEFKSINRAKAMLHYNKLQRARLIWLTATLKSARECLDRHDHDSALSVLDAGLNSIDSIITEIVTEEINNERR